MADRITIAESTLGWTELRITIVPGNQASIAFHVRHGTSGEWVSVGRDTYQAVVATSTNEALHRIADLLAEKGFR